MTAPYVDTSALAKWYLNEARSDDFEAFIRQQQSALISRLTVVEFHCLLARRRRAGDITEPVRKKIASAFDSDIGQGFLDVHPLDDRHALAALQLLSALAKHPLRTLDALHLAIAQDLNAAKLATADRTMAAAADALGFATVRFD